MTDLEYIRLHNLVHIKDAMDIIEHVIADANSDYGVPAKEKLLVERTLSDWRDKLQGMIRTR